jgi:ribonuclease D
MAAWKGSLENVEYLLDVVGCDINAYSQGEFTFGKTALFFAATQSRKAVLQALLQRPNAKVTIVNNKGQSVLSIAASHGMPIDVIERIQLLEEQQGDWWNFRESHSDGFEYGDLEPRFLERPLRATDVVTPLAINPTTKASRKGAFSRRNPQACGVNDKNLGLPQEKQQQQSKTKTSKESPLSQQEQDDWNQAWEQLLNHQESCSQEQAFQEALLSIVRLGDQQRQAWIPETADRLLQGFANDDEQRVQTLIQATMVQVANDQPPHVRRLVDLLRKLCLRVQRGGAAAAPSSSFQQKLPKKPSRLLQPIFLDSDPHWKRACGVVQGLNIFSLEDSEYPILKLPHPPSWIDNCQALKRFMTQLAAQELVAMDTEWHDEDDTTTALATLQIAYYNLEEDSSSLCVYVVDLKIAQKHDAEYHDLAQALVQHLLEKTKLLLGFAISQDLALLQAFCDTMTSTTTNNNNNSHLDLQLVALQDDSSSSSSLPGLKACAASFSNTPLSKDHQCSNWAQRPLSKAQLDYAGLDAAVLLVLLAEYSRKHKQNND